jgi:hypothetical protein
MVYLEESELQTVDEAILGKQLDKRNFRLAPCFLPIPCRARNDFQVSLMLPVLRTGISQRSPGPFADRAFRAPTVFGPRG